MRECIPLLQKNILFKDSTPDEIEHMLNCLQAKTKSFTKGTYVYNVNEKTTNFGIVLSGSVIIEKQDYWGNTNIINHIGAPDLFGESLALGNNPFGMGIQVLTREKTEILFMDIQKLLTPCKSICSFHTKIIQNLVQSLANKNRFLNEKIQLVSRRTTKDKILSYLSEESMKSRDSIFSIPFNRQELADYLGVDRSVLSATLSALKEEGFLDFYKNHFRLLKKTQN